MEGTPYAQPLPWRKKRRSRRRSDSERRSRRRPRAETARSAEGSTVSLPTFEPQLRASSVRITDISGPLDSSPQERWTHGRRRPAAITFAGQSAPSLDEIKTSLQREVAAARGALPAPRDQSGAVPTGGWHAHSAPTLPSEETPRSAAAKAPGGHVQEGGLSGQWGSGSAGTHNGDEVAAARRRAVVSAWARQYRQARSERGSSLPSFPTFDVPVRPGGPARAVGQGSELDGLGAGWASAGGAVQAGAGRASAGGAVQAGAGWASAGGAVQAGAGWASPGDAALGGAIRGDMSVGMDDRDQTGRPQVQVPMSGADQEYGSSMGPLSFHVSPLSRSVSPLTVGSPSPASRAPPPPPARRGRASKRKQQKGKRRRPQGPAGRVAKAAPEKVTEEVAEKEADEAAVAGGAVRARTEDPQRAARVAARLAARRVRATMVRLRQQQAAELQQPLTPNQWGTIAASARDMRIQAQQEQERARRLSKLSLLAPAPAPPQLPPSDPVVSDGATNRRRKVRRVKKRAAGARRRRQRQERKASATQRSERLPRTGGVREGWLDETGQALHGTHVRNAHGGSGEDEAAGEAKETADAAGGENDGAGHGLGEDDDDEGGVFHLTKLLKSPRASPVTIPPMDDRVSAWQMVLEEDDDGAVSTDEGDIVRRVVPPTPPPAGRAQVQINRRCPQPALVVVPVVGDGHPRLHTTAPLPVPPLKSHVACGLPRTGFGGGKSTTNGDDDDDDDDDDEGCGDEFFDTFSAPAATPHHRYQPRQRHRLQGCRPPRPRQLVPPQLEVAAPFLAPRAHSVVPTQLAVSDSRAALTLAFAM